MRLLASVCLDLWLLSQQPEAEPTPNGHAYQRAVAASLARPGLRCVQHSGLHTLWGRRSASGVRHEIDAATRGSGWAILVEAKTCELTKSELAVFEQKVTDYYFARWRSVARHAWSPIVTTTVPAAASTRRLALHRSLVLCDPARLPLPVLFHHATHPAAAGKLPQPLCTELVRLAPRALKTLQQRYIPMPEQGYLCLVPCLYTAGELDDLLFLQDELSHEVIDRYDRLRPGLLDDRAAWLRRNLPRRRAA